MSIKYFIAQNRRTLIVLLIVAIVFSTLILINHRINSPQFKKIINIENINKRIYEDLKRIDSETGLQRKVYFYVNGTNKDEVSYVVFCGGKEYQNGYDVDIVRLKDYSLVIELAYDFNIYEKSTSLVEYKKEFSMPIVIFKAKKIYNRKGELLYNTVNQNGEELERVLRWVY